MNGFKVLMTAGSILGGVVSGGWSAALGAVGGLVGSAGVDVGKDICDYLWFNAEEGYLKDFPDGRKDNFMKRLYKLAVSKPNKEEVNNGEGN